MQDRATEDEISAVITEFFSNKTEQEEDKSDFSEEEEEAAVLPVPLTSPADQPEAGPSQSSLGSESDCK